MKKHLKLIMLATLALGCHALHAGQPVAAASAPADASAAKGAIVQGAKGAAVVTGTNAAAATDPYAPKAASAFTGTSNDHNPFWPIGWVKTEEAADTSSQVIPKADDFAVTSILLNEPPMAVINGKEMAEGEIATVPVGNGTVNVQLMAVQDGRVVLRWENQNLVIPLQRHEDLSAADVSQQQPTVGLR